MKSLYLLCPNAEAALRLQTRLREAEIDATLAPTPREADHCCGLSIFLGEGEQKSQVEEVLAEGFCHDGFFETEGPNPFRMRFS